MSFFPTDRVSIVAELSCNHNGSLDNARRLVDAAKHAGATHVKLQAYTAEELIALRGDGQAPAPWDHLTMRELYEAAATPFDWFPYLIARCEEVGIPWFASVFGAESLAAMEAVGCPAYKLAAMEAGNVSLLEMVEATGKPVVASSPMRTGPVVRNYPVLCPPGYPQPEAHINQVDRFWGYSYHGTDPDIPAYAVAAGARYIETHLMLEDEPSKFEADFAFTTTGFAEMVRRVRKAEGAL